MLYTNPLSVVLVIQKVSARRKSESITGPGCIHKEFQSIKDKHADQPAKTGDTLPYLGFASVKRPWWETTHFQKCTFMKDVLCSVIERIMKLNYWF